MEKCLHNALEQQVEKSLKAVTKRTHLDKPQPTQGSGLCLAEPGPSTSFLLSRELSPPPLEREQEGEQKHSVSPSPSVASQSAGQAASKEAEMQSDSNGLLRQCSRV